MTTDLDIRAAAVLGTGPDGIRWPRHLVPADPEAEQYDRLQRQQQARQEAMVSWAEEFGLKLTPIGCCPPWLLRPISRRCHPYTRVGDRCTRYGTLQDRAWLQRTMTWLKDGRPAAITCAPVDFSPAYVERLRWWQQAAPKLRVVTGPGSLFGRSAT